MKRKLMNIILIDKSLKIVFFFSIGKNFQNYFQEVPGGGGDINFSTKLHEGKNKREINNHLHFKHFTFTRSSNKSHQ